MHLKTSVAVPASCRRRSNLVYFKEVVADTCILKQGCSSASESEIKVEYSVTSHFSTVASLRAAQEGVA
jgi:hypothetical protein